VRILSILGAGGSFGGLVLAFFELKKASQGSAPSGSRGSGRSSLLMRIAWIVFIVACLAGTGSFLIHLIFPF
jgi:hypothetical protein